MRIDVIWPALFNVWVVAVLGIKALSLVVWVYATRLVTMDDLTCGLACYISNLLNFGLLLSMAFMLVFITGSSIILLPFWKSSDKLWLCPVESYLHRVEINQLISREVFRLLSVPAAPIVQKSLLLTSLLASKFNMASVHCVPVYFFKIRLNLDKDRLSYHRWQI